MFASYLVSSLSLMVCFAITSFQCFLLADFFGLASFGRCSPKTDTCLVASSVGGSLSFLVPSSFAPSWPTGPTILFSLFRFTLLTTHLPLSLVFSWPAILTPKYPASGAALPLHLILFWPVILTPGYPVSSSSLPLRRILFWPAILTPGYPVSGASLPLRLTLFDRLFWRPAIRFSFLSPAPPRLILTGYFDARLSGFRCLSPAPQRLLLTGYFTARISGFRCPISRSASSFSDRLFWRPGLPFPVPQGLLFTPRFGILGRLFRRPPFSHPTFPSRLFGWPARSLCRLTVGLRFLPLRGFYRPAVFTAPRFLPLRFHRFFGGLCSSTALELAAPQSSPTSGRLALSATLRYACGFTAPRFLPLRGFYRSAVFTAPRFLPLRGFYRSAIFAAPRFLPLRDFFRSAFAGSLGGSTLPFCPPVFALFRAHPVLPAPP